MAETPCVIDNCPESWPKETAVRNGNTHKHKSDANKDANKDARVEFDQIITFEVKSRVQVLVVEKRTNTVPPT